MSVFHRYHEQLQDAIVRRLGWKSLRAVQEEASEAILDGNNAIILAPTAGGKTEASFFPVLSEVLSGDQAGLQVLYIAPIKALLNNQAERLAKYTEMVGLSRCVWHGDIGQSRRNRFLREPDTVLMTTPESLEVMLVSGRINHVKLFKTLRYVIIDEIHALAGSDRGTHLRSVLSRIFVHSDHDVQRIGLSATVGNPDEILRWLSSDSSRPGKVINPVVPPQNKQILIVQRDTDSNLAHAVAKVGQGQKSLLFCQSRSLTEKVAERMGDLGIDTYVHHSSISKEERGKAEELFQKEGAACIVCTSTLELGIDIGDLDKVFQAEAPTTVSSFLQRLGRTGRREGQVANTTFFCGSREGVLQAAALVELAKDRWVEKIRINPRTWPGLVHQILVICMGQGGISFDALWRQISTVPDFSGITEAEFNRLIKHMLNDHSIEQLDGRVLLGSKSERLFGKRNFMSLYAVFSSPKTYTVETKEKHPIGQLAQDFVDQLNEDSCFILGGKPWAIVTIRHEDRMIKVMPAPKGKQPTWGGMLPQFLSFEICQKIKSILKSDTPLSYIKGQAAITLEEEREDATFIFSGPELIGSEDKHTWYTYAGGHINTTLKYALQNIGGWKVTANNFSLDIKCTEIKDIEAAITLMQKSEFWSSETLWKDILSSLPQYRLSKFQDIMPQWAIEEMIAAQLLDLKGTWDFIVNGTTNHDWALNYETIPKVAWSKNSYRQKTVQLRKNVPRPDKVTPSAHSQLKLPITYVSTDEQLADTCNHLIQFAELGIDCETTIPAYRMCLLQIACRDHVYLIDPFTISDFTPLKSILEDKKILLIAHNASFEEKQLKSLNIQMNNIYDTLKISRKIRGRKTSTNEKIPHGLKDVCDRELGLDMSKEQQSSDWSVRPLSNPQLEYAALDAEVMLQLYDRFEEIESEQLGLF